MKSFYTITKSNTLLFFGRYVGQGGSSGAVIGVDLWKGGVVMMMSMSMGGG